MPLQNRVTPFGEIIAVPERGALMGNRGILHDDAGRIVRSWQVRRWIACRTAFRGRQRQLLQPHSWTGLFFLDEATAFAAGHRPCAECRHADYQRFKEAWAVGVGLRMALMRWMRRYMPTGWRGVALASASAPLGAVGQPPRVSSFVWMVRPGCCGAGSCWSGRLGATARGGSFFMLRVVSRS